jgi:hypothetical protein
MNNKDYDTRIMRIPFEEESVSRTIREYIGSLDVKTIRLQDGTELAKIGMHYRDIADRICQIIDFAEGLAKSGVPWHRGKIRQYLDVQEESLFREFKARGGEGFGRNSNDSLWHEFLVECLKLRAYYPETHLDEKVAVVKIGTSPLERCPFNGCDFHLSRGDPARMRTEVHAFSLPAQVFVRLDRWVEDLARKHKILPKKNGYSITPEAFKEAFMPEAGQ